MRRYVPRFRFDPYSFEELWKPVEYATQVHRDVQDKLSANEMAAAEFLSYIDKDKDPVPYQIAQNYLASIDTAARDLNTKGLGSVGYARLMGLNSEYAHNVKPIENAVKNQQAYIAAQRQLKASNPSIAFVRDGSQMKLDEFKNGQPDLTYVDGNKVKQDAAMMAQALFSKKFTGMSKQKFDHYNDLVLMRYGMSLQDMIDNPNTKQSYDMMMNAVFDSNGVGNLNEQEQYRMKQLFNQGVTIGAAVTEQAQIVDNGNKFREQMAASRSRAKVTQGKLDDILKSISQQKKLDVIPHGKQENVTIHKSGQEKIDKFIKLKNIYIDNNYLGTMEGENQLSINQFLASKEGKEFVNEIVKELKNNNTHDNRQLAMDLSAVIKSQNVKHKENTYIHSLDKTYKLNTVEGRNKAFEDLITKFYEAQSAVISSASGYELNMAPDAKEQMIEGVFSGIANDSPDATIVHLKNSGRSKNIPISGFDKDDLKGATISLDMAYAHDNSLLVNIKGERYLINLDQVNMSYAKDAMTEINKLYKENEKLRDEYTYSNSEDITKQIKANSEQIEKFSTEILNNLRQNYLYNQGTAEFYRNNDPSMIQYNYEMNAPYEQLIMLQSMANELSGGE